MPVSDAKTMIPEPLSVELSTRDGATRPFRVTVMVYGQLRETYAYKTRAMAERKCATYVARGYTKI